MLGVGGVRVFELLGLEEGTALFSFVYARSWGVQEEVAKFEYIVNVFIPEDE
jgi:predicted secreted protein